MVCGYSVPESEVGTLRCFGCHFAMKDESNPCSWIPEDGVNELDGPSAYGPSQLSGGSQK